MPAQSRAERRRANTRQQQQPRPATTAKPRIYDAVANTTAIANELSLETTKLAAPEVPVMTAPTAVGGSKVARRLRNRAAPEPVDYTKDIRDASRDLRLIALWAVLMFVAMLALYFARARGLF